MFKLPLSKSRNKRVAQTDRILAFIQDILEEEVTHSRDGLKWFKHVCQAVYGLDEIGTLDKFHSTVRMYFKGTLRGPFNDKDRWVPRSVFVYILFCCLQAGHVR